MTDRRRNFAVLVLVGLLLAGSVVAIALKPTKLGLDLKGGVELVYQAQPTNFSQVTDEAVTRSIDIMRQRVDALGVAEPEIQRTGEDQISVSLPDVTNADEAISQVGTTAQLFFYDWEKNVIGPDGKPAPADFGVTGGPQAGQAGCVPYFDALARARRVPPQTGVDAAAGDRFYFVNDRTRTVVAGPEKTEQALRDSEKGRTALAKTGKNAPRLVKVNSGVVLVQAEGSADAGLGEGPDCWFVLRDDYALRGTDIKNPEQNFNPQTNAPNVTFDFTSRGRRIWQDVTREIAQRGQNLVATADGQPLTNPTDRFQHFAIVLDNQLVSVPYIDFQQNPDGIDGGSGSEISGGFTIKTAQRLANQLKYGALPIELELISQSQVSATLGQEALDQGLVAGIAGFVVVALFLVAFYRVLGLIAVVALAVYAVYFFALIKLIPITLTLPGIAGLILTIGVTADANIVIFERVKEEIRNGRSVPAGIALGYKKGLAAIIDANVVIFMTSFILFVLATAGVKGFAFVLGIGTLVTLLTAVLFVQAILGTLGRSKAFNSEAAVGASGEAPGWARFDFMGLSNRFFAMSGLILLVGALAIGGKGLNFGIDFESGTRIRAALTKPATEDSIRQAIASTPAGDAAEVQRVEDQELGSNAFQISTGELRPAEVSTVTSALQRTFGIRGAPDTQSIGPTFGETVAKGAIIAIIASLLVISAYIALRFEWKYAVPVVIALAHDLLITAGVYSLTGREVTTSTVAALLTILGFSLYDTIIVFDRVRENIPRMPSATYSQVVNRSMSEVLIRSLATSFCTGLPILALMVFGGETLRDFAFALLVGVLSGAYSSIFIASPVLAHWKEREAVWRRRTARVQAQYGGAVPAYAVAGAGGLVDVDVPETPRKRRLTAPDDPNRQVSKAEFDQMVAELHADEQAAGSQRVDPTADASPDEVYMKDDKPKRDKSARRKSSRHGRPR